MSPTPTATNPTTKDRNKDRHTVLSERSIWPLLSSTRRRSRRRLQPAVSLNPKTLHVTRSDEPTSTLFKSFSNFMNRNGFFCLPRNCHPQRSDCEPVFSCKVLKTDTLGLDFRRSVVCHRLRNQKPGTVGRAYLRT